MQRVLSTHLLANHRLTTAWLEKIQNSGNSAVEILCARKHLDYRNRAQVNELAHWFRDSSLKLFSLHLPMHSDEVWGRSGPRAVLNITEMVKSRRVEVADEIKRALEIAESIPCQYAVQHLGVAGEEWDERKVDAAFSSLEEICLFAKQRGVSVLLENIPNEFSSAHRLMTFLELTHMNLDFCFDTGHANLMGGVESEFEIMKPRIRSTHIHDNDGETDTHKYPFVCPGGTVDWKRTMELFRPMADQFPLLLEFKEQPGIEAPLEAAKSVFEQLENL